MVEEFNKTRKVTDQRLAAENSMFTTKPDGTSSRLPGPDAILESIANGKLDDSPGRFSSSSPPDATRWGNSDPSPGQASQAASDDSESGSHAPGIPMILAQARGQTAIAPAPTALTYDSDNALLPMGELDAVLPEVGPAPSPRNDGRFYPPHAGPGGSADFIFQHPITHPNPSFMMAQQSYMGMQKDGDGNRRMNPFDFPQPPGYN